MKNKKLLGSFLLVITAAIWGTAFAFQRMGMDSIEPAVFNASRMLLAAVAVTPLIFLGRSRDAADGNAFRRNTVKGGILCGLCLAGASVLQQIGMVHTGAGKAGFITAMYMLLVPVFNLLLFRRKSPLIVWLAVAAGIAGMYLLCIKEGFTIDRGDGLILICAVLFAFHIICCDHYVKNANPIGMAAIQFYVTAFVSGLVSAFTENPSWSDVRAALIPILYCGLGSGGIAYTLQIVAQKFTDPTVATIIMSLESVFAVLGGALILGEKMSLREAAGCILMFAAVILVQIPVGSKKKKEIS
jgi:drug/metabolite transporter (DMT)-like permease